MRRIKNRHFAFFSEMPIFLVFYMVFMRMLATRRFLSARGPLQPILLWPLGRPLDVESDLASSLRHYDEGVVGEAVGYGLLDLGSC